MFVAKACSRPGCHQRAIAQVIYAYRDLNVEVGPLGDDPPAGSYQLCPAHLERLSVPKGWQLIRRGKPKAGKLTDQEIEALAQEIRRVGGLLGTVEEVEATEHSLSRRTNLVTLTSRAHLRVVADSSRYEPA